MPFYNDAQLTKSFKDEVPTSFLQNFRIVELRGVFITLSRTYNEDPL